MTISQKVIAVSGVEQVMLKESRDRRRRGEMVKKGAKRERVQDTIGKMLGMEGVAYMRARRIVRSGDAAAIAEMDKTGMVYGVYGRMFEGSKARRRPATRVKDIEKSVRKAVKRLEASVADVQFQSDKPSDRMNFIKLRHYVGELVVHITNLKRSLRPGSKGAIDVSSNRCKNHQAGLRSSEKHGKNERVARRKAD